MKKQIIALAAVFMILAPAANAGVPLTVQWRVKQSVLFVPRTVKFLVEGAGVKEAVYYGWHADEINSASGQEFKFFSLH